MLIMPLHRAVTRANFPWVTLGLILVNVFVFFGLQLGDGERHARALAYYADEHLAEWEFPAYRAWLEREGGDAAGSAEFGEKLEDDDARWLTLLQADARFLHALRAGSVIAPDAPEYAEWKPRRDEFDRLSNAVVTDRWMLRFSEIDPARMLGAMFLHGGFLHLFFNMLFLAAIGLLVEGALGPLLFLALYLAGGFGSALFSLAWRWGDVGTALGASGAIASLMGAYCVLWGRRKVRFFWWFLVVFDYVKAPALVLLPFWLGWELLNLALNDGAHIGFDAHAGGIVAGALLALGVRSLHWERRAFLDEDEIADAAAEAKKTIARANEHIGRLEIPAARALLEPLAEKAPDDLTVRAALYRCARYEPQMPRIDAAARAALSLAVKTAAEVRAQKAIYDEYVRLRGARAAISPSLAIALATRWPAIGAGADAAALLARVIERSPSATGLDAACLAVARALKARSENAAAKTLLERVVRAWPGSVEADKARLLLAEGA